MSELPFETETPGVKVTCGCKGKRVLGATCNIREFLTWLTFFVCFFVVNEICNFNRWADLSLVFAAALSGLLVVDTLLYPIPKLAVHITSWRYEPKLVA